MNPEDSPTAAATPPSTDPVHEAATDSPAEQAGGFLNQVQQQLDALRALVTQSGKRQGDLTALESALRNRQSDLEARERELAARAEALDNQQQALSARAAEIESRAHSHEARAVELTQREQALDERESAAGAAELALGQARAERDAERVAREKAEQQLEETHRQRAQAVDQAEQAERHIARLSAELEEARRSVAAAVPAPDTSASDALLADLQSRLETSEHSAARLTRQLAERDETLREVVHRLREAEEQAEARAAEPAPVADDSAINSVALRRARLARYKRLLAAQSGKIVKARAALQKRAAECEAVLAQRSRLADEAAALAEQRRKIEQRSAKSQAAAVMLYAMLTILAVGGSAWALARQIAPATFAARAEISADGKGRTLLPEELAGWSSQMTALAQDPQVMAAAAENFARRGFVDLGTTSAVKQRFSSLYTQSDKPGTMTLEVKGQGAERTARELETFLSALLSVAGTQRESSGIGAATVISKPAAAGSEPLDHLRWAYTGAIAGGGLFLAGLIATMAYRSLSRAKERFESDAGEAAAMA
ncbi:MAG: hypothetical protein AB7K52_12875 [Phycisphaerales bacterium]